MKKIIVLVGLFALMAFGFQNCGPMVEEAPLDLAQLDTLYANVHEAVGLQCDELSDCEQAPVGEKTCGGPSMYLVYSRKDTDLENLNTWIAQVNQYELRLSASGMPSTCNMVLPYLSLECENQRCVGKNEIFR